MLRVINWLFSNWTLAIVLLATKALAFGVAGMLPGWGWLQILVAFTVIALVGLALRKDWGRWLGIVLLCVATIHGAYLLMKQGITGRRALATAATAYIAWGLWKKPNEGFFSDDDDDDAQNSGQREEEDDDDEKPLISLVHLRSSKRYLEPAVLAQALSDAWGLKLEAKEDRDDEPSDDSDGFVAGGDSVYFVFTFKPAMVMLMVHNREGQYFSDVEELARKVPNLRFANIIREHAAWLAIDLMEGATAPQMHEQAYQMIGKAITALADDDTLALFCPQHKYFNLWSEELENILCGPNPLGAFKKEVKAPVIGVKDSVTMEEAIAEAKRRWPEFVAAFKERDPKDPRFIVKAAFTTGENTEHMWMEVIGIEPEYVHGHLVNEPIHHPTLKQGSQVEVPVADISDWVFARGDEPVGNFTGHLVNAAAKPHAD